MSYEERVRVSDIKHIHQCVEAYMTKGQANRLLRGWGLRKNSHKWDVTEIHQKFESLSGWMVGGYDAYGNEYRRCCTFEEAHAEFGISRPAFNAMLKGSPETTIYVGKVNGREFELYLDHFSNEYAHFDLGAYETYYGFGTDFAAALEQVEAYLNGFELKGAA